MADPGLLTWCLPSIASVKRPCLPWKQYRRSTWVLVMKLFPKSGYVK